MAAAKKTAKKRPTKKAGARSASEARATWDGLGHTHRRGHVEHVEDARKPETRQRRIEKSVARLAAGRKELR